MESTTASLMKKLSRYESEISSILGMLVVAALAVFIFLFVKRFMPKPSITPIAETTQETENLMKTNANKKTYTVKAGQGLSQIALEVYKDKSAWKKIAEANKLKAPYALEKGQELTLPDLTADKAAAATSTTTLKKSTEVKPEVKAVKPAVIAETTKEGTYTVVKGDHLWKIAQKQYGSGYAWTKIYKANKKLIGKNPGLIYAGTTLVLPN